MTLTYWKAPYELLSIKDQLELIKRKEDERSDNEIYSDIEDIICKYLQLDLNKVRSMSRKRELVTARQYIFYLVRKYTKLSLKQIASRYMDRDHSTIIHSNNKLQDLADTEPETRRTLKRLEAKII